MRHGRIDANHREIVAALRAVGCSVQSLADIGHGCADIVVGYHGANYLLEVKAGKGRLTADEIEWMQAWRGQYQMVRSVEEALRAIGHNTDMEP